MNVGLTEPHWYTPSAIESKWAALVRQLRPMECDDWHPGSELLKEMVALTNAPDQLAPSLVRERQHSQLGGTTEIEPLVSLLRNPLAITQDCSTGGCDHKAGRARIMDKSWIALPRHLQPALRQAGGRVIFFDLGAGTNAGADNAPA